MLYKSNIQTKNKSLEIKTDSMHLKTQLRG